MARCLKFRLDKISGGGEQPTDAELSRWIASFPIEGLGPWQSGKNYDGQKSLAAILRDARVHISPGDFCNNVIRSVTFAGRHE